MQELAVVVRALGRIPLRDAVALDLQEAAELAHQAGTADLLASALFDAARACSRAASPSRTRRGRAARPSCSSTRAATGEPVRCSCSAISARSSIASAADELFEADHAHVAALGEARRARRARRRRRRSCRPRSCARSDRARRRVRRSCTRSRGRRRPRRRPTRRSCAPRSARRRARGRTRVPRGRAVEHGVADDHVLLGDEVRAPCPRAGAPRGRRPTAPCRRSRWRRRAA